MATNLTIHVEEEWFDSSLEAKLHKKIDVLQGLVQQQMELLHVLCEEVRQLKEVHTVHRTPQQDRTNELLEELKVLKQRELNMMLREKKPTPFISSHSFLPFSSFPYKKNTPTHL